MKENFKKIITRTLAIALFASAVTGCSLFRKKTDGSATSNTSDSGIKTETTADGGSEKIETSPMNFSNQGSDSGQIDGLKTVFFEYDKAVLSESEQSKLAANAEWLKANSNAKLTIEGHCDEKGSNEYNLSLGERRANTIKKVLEDLGIASKRLSTVSFGEEKPLIQSDDESAMSKNRRANFVPVN